MAVSLTQLSKDASRRQSMDYYTTTATFMPMQDQFNQPFPQNYFIPPPPPNPPTIQRQTRPRHATLPSSYKHQRAAHEIRPPSRPSKTPLEQTVDPVAAKPPRKHTTSLIEPDPLPPHSNPQALSQSQSKAFSDSSPIPPVRIGKDEVRNPQNDQALYTITRAAAHAPNFISTKPLVNVSRINGIPIGTVRFHTLTSNHIDLTVNGRATSISHSGLIHNRWGFPPTTGSNGGDEKWYWKKDKITGGAKLEDSKKNGHTLAKMKGDLLTFEVARLKDAMYDEVLLSAVAMAEAARRQKRNGDIADLASAIGDFADAAGGDSGGDGGIGVNGGN